MNIKNIFSQKISLGYVVVILVGISSLLGAYIGITTYFSNQAEKYAGEINTILLSNTTSIGNCSTILSFNGKKLYGKSHLVDMRSFSTFKTLCENTFDISKVKLTEYSCPAIIAKSKDALTSDYLILDGFETAKNTCLEKFQKVIFATGSYFDVENDFKSTFSADFSLPMFYDEGQEDTEQFIKNRGEAKEKILSYIQVTPSTTLTPDDVVLSGQKAIISANLEPLKEYEVVFAFSGSTGEKVTKSSLKFTTPENKYLGIKLPNKVTLYTKDALPKLQLLEYNTDKTRATLKVCRVDSEGYAKAEVYLENRELKEERKKFFTSGIDALPNQNCIEKPIEFGAEKTPGTVKLIKKDILLSDILGADTKTGLYYATFRDPANREYNGRLQTPILFGVIDSHITMKVSLKGDGFFFVTDFAGNPLEGQEIKVMANEFIGKEGTWDYTTQKENVKYFTPDGKNIFSKEILLGKTGKDGVLQVDLKGKIDDYFGKMFEGYDFSYNGNYNSFFVTTTGSHQSYLSSKWNGGIAPWNFGYTVSDYWYGSNVEQNDIQISRWQMQEPELYAHLYTDRVLYLPNEIVEIKAVTRNSKDLSIPKGKEFTLKVFDPTWKEIQSETVKANDYGSVLSKITLPKDTPFGAYSIALQSGDIEVMRTGFSVEVFKNPKFTSEITLKTEGLTGDIVNITKTEKEENNYSYYGGEKYTGKFDIKATVFTKYYAGGNVKNTPFDYKVYKQYYYPEDYWNDCYYGCYWEPQKEFYTSGTGMLDNSGFAGFTIPVEFESYYNDYKYIVEVTVTDNAGDTISSSNSIIAKLPSEYKSWNPNSDIDFSAPNKFYKQGENITISGGLKNGKWDIGYDDKFIMLVKKKDFTTKKVIDVRGVEKSVSEASEKLVDILPIGTKSFTLTPEGKLTLSYAPKETGEYVFEYGKLNSREMNFTNLNIQRIIEEFKETGVSELEKQVNKKIVVDYGSFESLVSSCAGSSEECSRENLIKQLGCEGSIYGEECYGKEKTIDITQKIYLRDIISTKKYFSVLTYGEVAAKNPVHNDNKIHVLSEKISYKPGETAKVLVRLPFENGKILWTIEKQGVENYEYINVKGNMFFKEVLVDESMVPNAYIGVVAIDPKGKEYKVGYTEIVVDKADKKATISIKPEREVYAPRDEVKLDISVTGANTKPVPSELTVMVVDDSLISLMGNIDPNTLEKIIRKLPFQIQTAITNIAMLKNYYFSRPGVVGGGGLDHLKGGDSAISTRNIFKNTAYYNGSVITDANGKASVTFTLPDNLTNFRIIVLSNAKTNFFGYEETFIKVRQPIVVEEKTPLIVRESDTLTVGANVFNNTTQEQKIDVVFESTDIQVSESKKSITLKPDEHTFVTFNASVKNAPDDIMYTISAIGNSAKNSDKLERHITLKESPTLINSIIKSGIIKTGSQDFTLTLPENTNIEKSLYELFVSNNPLSGIEKIIKSLLIYPYGCIEQSVSSTMPNVIVKKFNTLIGDIGVDAKVMEDYIKKGIERIASMQLADGGFGYWQGDSQSNLHITPYVLRSLVEMNTLGADIQPEMIANAQKYLETNLQTAQDDTERTEIFWTLAKLGKGKIVYDTYFKTPESKANFSRHQLIAYTYGLVLMDKGLYEKEIQANISKIQVQLTESVSDWYWDTPADKAIFASLLMDFGYDETYIHEIVKSLYDYDFSSFYYSTQTKNNAFIAFVKYLEKYGKNNVNDIKLTLNGVSKTMTIGGSLKSYVSKVSLSEVLKDNTVALSVENLKGKPLFVTAKLDSYPTDILKVKPYANGIQLERKIYEVVDMKKLEDCNNYYYYDESKNGNCESALSLHTGEVFKKGATYKIVLSAKFSDAKERKNFTFEDYLPASFRVLNSKFKTNSIATSQNTTQTWYFDHVEILPSMVMANASYVWGETATYEYFITPEFEGSFVYPPATAYMMYEPEVRASGEFRRIEVR